MNIVNWQEMSQDYFTTSDWSNWLKENGYKEVCSEPVKNSDKNFIIFALNSGLFAVFIPVDVGVVYHNIPSWEDVLSLINTAEQMFAI